MKFFLNGVNFSDQLEISKIISKIIFSYPLIIPRTPKFDKPFKVQITNAGTWGWISDKHGYRYVKKHPSTQKKWPPIPCKLINIWKKFLKEYNLPNSCLINLYTYPESKLGLHQDIDENDLTCPVMSISLGSKAVFKYGETKKNLKQKYLSSGAIVLMGGKSRLFYHGVSKILKVENNVLSLDKIKCFPPDSRINITMRYFKNKAN